MYYIAIDTCGSCLAAVLAEDGCVLRSVFRCRERSHGQYLAPSMRLMLRRSGIDVSQVHFFAAAVGPGSFTGIRIGLATLKAMSLALNKPLVGFSSLDVFAWAAAVQSDSLWAVMDAQRNQVYAARYRRGPRSLERCGEYVLQPLADFSATVSEPAVLAGDAVRSYPELARLPGSRIVPVPGRTEWVRALAQLSFFRFKTGQTCTAETIDPLYLYPENCTVRGAPR